MSSVLTPVNGDIVTVSTHKHLLSNPGARWSNTYDFLVLDAASGTLFTEMYVRTWNFEKQLMHTGVHFDEVRVSTFAPDSRPYNPESFLTVELDDVGLVVPTADLEPLAIAWLIERQVATGRVGKLFMRGVLAENGVNSAGGKPALSFPSANAAALSAALGASNLDQMFAGVAVSSVMVVAHRNKITHAVTTRQVESFVSKDAIIAKLSHKRKRRIIIGG